MEEQVFEQSETQTEASPEIDASATPETAPVEHEQEQQAPKTFTQEELDAIVQREKAKAEAKAERRARKQWQESQAAQAQRHDAMQPVPPSMPKREQFQDEDAYLDARDAYRDAVKEQRKTVEELNRATHKIYKEAAKIPEFDRDAFDELPLTANMARALIESDEAPKIMAYLSQNPDEVERIAALSPARQAAATLNLEEKVTGSGKQTSKAPAPIKPISGERAAPGKSLEKQSMAEYLKSRRDQKAWWAT